MEIVNISKSFEGKKVLKNFSLSLPNAGRVGLFAPSGSGKTTLLHLIAGLLQPEEGSISGTEHKKIGYVFQEDRLLPWLDAVQNVAAVLTEKEKDKAAHYLQAFGIDKADFHKKPAELSGGMKRRVDLARLAAYRPDIFLLDEPLGALDERNRLQLLEKLREMSEDKLLILVSHDAEEVLSLCDDIQILDGPPLTFIESIKVKHPLSENEKRDYKARMLQEI